MKSKPRLYLSAVLLIFSCALAPPEGLCAQQPTAQEIDQLTGPIALYPDAIVFHILTAAQKYDTVKSFAGWLEKNDKLKGSELQNAAEKAGFDPALVALAPFPQVVQMMVQKPDWTKALGQAVTADKKAVSDSIQRLRAQAQALGNLKTTPQQVVVVTNTIVQIQPANPQVIYVPTYPQTVYVQQAPPPSSASVASAALVGFTVGVIVANNNNYYHHQEEYWEERNEHYDQRQANAQANQDQRQSTAQGNQDQRQGNSQERQDQRTQSGTPSSQSQGAASQSARQSGTAPAQSQAAASPSQRQSAPTAASRGSSQTAARSSGMSSSGASSYQSGSATRSQSSRGSASMSSSRSGGGRSGGGRGR